MLSTATSDLLSEFLEVAWSTSEEIQEINKVVQNCWEVCYELQSDPRAIVLGLYEDFGAYVGPEVDDGKPYSFIMRYRHHWLVADGKGLLPAGTIVDPTANQFPGQSRVRLVWPWFFESQFYCYDYRTEADEEEDSDASACWNWLFGHPDDATCKPKTS